MEGFLPDRLEFDGTVEIDPGSLYDRIASAAGRVVDLFIGSGSAVERGAAVLTITGDAYVSAQEEFIRAFSEGAGTALDIADLAHPLKEKEAVLTGLKLARSQIDQIRTNRRVIDPLPVLCPFNAILTRTVSADESFPAGASLYAFIKEQYIRFRMEAEQAEYLRKGKQAKIVLPDGRQAAAFFDSLGEHHQNGTREVRLKTGQPVAAVGQTVQIEFRFEWFERATPTCTKADWPFPTQPRGTEFFRLRELHARKTGTALPKALRPSATSTEPLRYPVVSFLSSRPTRELARYSDPDLPSAPPSKRCSLFIDPKEFASLKLSTMKATPTPINPRWRCPAEVMEYAPPEQPFHVSAPYGGRLFPEPLRRNDLIDAGKLIGTVCLTAASVSDQQILLEDPEQSIRECAEANLRAIGFVDRDFESIRVTRAPITRKEIFASSTGFILEYAGHERDVSAGESVLRMLCRNAHLIRAALRSEEYMRLPSIIRADLLRPFRTDASSLYSINSTRITERSRKSSFIEFEVVFPADKERLPPGHRLELELSDLAGTRQAICIPRDCIMKIGESNEVLVHSKGGMFTPAAIRIGHKHGDLVEVLGGIAENCFLVRDLKALTHASPAIRAIMGGFWTPPSRTAGLAF